MYLKHFTKKEYPFILLSLMAGFFFIAVNSCKYQPANNNENLNQICDTLYENAFQNKFDNAKLEHFKNQCIAFENDSLLANYYIIKGFYFEAKSRYDSAFDCYLKSLNLRKKRNDLNGVGRAMNNMAEAAQELNQFDIAAQYLDSALHLFREQKDTPHILKSLQQLGYLQSLKEHDKTAKNTFLYAYSLAKKIADTSLLSTFENSLGNIYLELAHYDSSFLYYKKALQNPATHSDTTQLIKVYTNLGRLFLQFGKPDSTKYYFNLCHQIINRFGNSEDKLILLENESLYESYTRNYKNAYDSLQKLNVLYSSYNQRKAAKNIADMEVKYKTAEKEQQNKLLKAENSRQSWIIFTLISSAILLGFSALFIYRNARQKQVISKQQLNLKDNEIVSLLKSKELETFDAALRGQDEERARIARELHDRLGSLLSIAKLNFSSLQSDLQKLEEKNLNNYQQVSSMLEEAADEVRRISHDLYAGSVINFGIVTALYQLTDAVSAANKIQVKFQHKNVPLNLSSDQQINLYRTVQELLSNTLKYAGAERIDMQLIGNAVGNITFTYEDNGKGFDLATTLKNAGIGFKNIENRMRKINATYNIDSFPGRGMSFMCEFKNTEAEL